MKERDKGCYQIGSTPRMLWEAGEDTVRRRRKTAKYHQETRKGECQMGPKKTSHRNKQELAD